MQEVAKKAQKVATVLVLVEARPRIVPEEFVDSISAVIDAYLPGPCTSTSLGDQTM